MRYFLAARRFIVHHIRALPEDGFDDLPDYKNDTESRGPPIHRLNRGKFMDRLPSVNMKPDGTSTFEQLANMESDVTLMITTSTQNRDREVYVSFEECPSPGEFLSFVVPYLGCIFCYSLSHTITSTDGTFIRTTAVSLVDYAKFRQSVNALAMQFCNLTDMITLGMCLTLR